MNIHYSFILPCKSYIVVIHISIWIAWICKLKHTFFQNIRCSISYKSVLFKYLSSKRDRRYFIYFKYASRKFIRRI